MSSWNAQVKRITAVCNRAFISCYDDLGYENVTRTYDKPNDKVTITYSDVAKIVITNVSGDWVANFTLLIVDAILAENGSYLQTEAGGFLVQE